MGSQVSHPVIVEQVRPGLYCCRWRMADSVRDFRCYANTFKLRGRCPSAYSITATWVDKKYSVVIDSAGHEDESKQKRSHPVCQGEPGSPSVKRTDVPQSVWMSYGGGQNQQLQEITPGTWKTDDFQFNTSLGQRPLPYRVMASRPWAGCGLTFRLWLDFQTTSLGERTTLKQLETIFTQQSRCDVHFQLGSESIGAHTAVLSARSPVFAAMFQHDMLEAHTRTVFVPDIDAAVFKQLLHYVYAGKAPELKLSADDVAQPLLLAADKYDVGDLKEECLSLIKSRMTVDNVIDTLIWAYYHSMTRLVEVALMFIAQHGQESCAGRSDLEEVSQKCPELYDLMTNREEVMINHLSLCPC